MKYSFLILTLIVLPAWLWAQQSPELRALLRAGNQAYSRGEMIAAEIQYRKALDKFPETSEASYNLGNALFRQGRYDQAIVAYAAVSERSKDPRLASRALYNQGNAQMAREDYESAADAFRNALRQDPANDAARHNLSLVMKKIEEQHQPPKDQDKESQREEEQQQQEQQEDQETKDPAKDSPEDAPPSSQPPSRPMTPEEADQMLKRLELKEQMVQNQIRQKQNRGKIRGSKDW